MRNQDKWVFGQNMDGDREYIVHLHHPRFVARIFAGSEAETDEGGQDDGAGQGIQNDAGETIIVTQWLDPTPPKDILSRLLRETASAHEIYTQDSFERFPQN